MALRRMEKFMSSMAGLILILQYMNTPTCGQMYLRGLILSDGPLLFLHSNKQRYGMRC